MIKYIISVLLMTSSSKSIFYNSVFQLDSNDEENRHLIYMFGRDKDGKSISFVVTDYPIRVYFQLPPTKDFDWADNTGVSAITTLLKTPLGQAPNKRTISKGFYKETDVEAKDNPYNPHVEYCHSVKNPLRGKEPFLKVFYTSQAAVQEARRTSQLQSAKMRIGTETYSLEMVEDSIEPLKKLLVDKKLPYSGWIQAEGESIPHDDIRRKTTSEIEIHCSWKTLADSSNKISQKADYSELFYDIECLGKNHLFPDKFDPYCCITQITYTFRHKNHLERIALVYGDAKARVKKDREPVITINVENETQLIEKHFELIIKYDPDIISGYNIFGFDEEYIYRRSVIVSVKIPQKCSRMLNKPIKYWDRSWSSANNKKVDVKYIDLCGRCYIDVYKYVATDQTLKLNNNKLNTVAMELLGTGKHDVSAQEMFSIHNRHQRVRKAFQKCVASYNDKGEANPHSNVSKEVWDYLIKEYIDSTKDLQVVIEYCLEDTALSMKLYDKLGVLQTLSEFSNIFQVRVSDVNTRGQSSRGISQLYTRLRAENIILNKLVNTDTNKIQGALNLGTILKKRGLFRDMASLDVQSMYPSQIRKHNISIDTEITEEEYNTIYKGKSTRFEWKDYEGTELEKSYVVYIVHSSVRRGFFPKMLDDLIMRRGEAKKLMNEAVDPSERQGYNSRQLGLKIGANSVYGMLAMAEHSPIPAKHLGSLVTHLSRVTLMDIYNFLITGSPSAEWSAENISTKLPTFPIATVFYGDTDSVQFNYPQLSFNSPIELIDFYTKLTQAINTCISPLKVELEKIGEMLLEGPKHYAIKLRNIERWTLDRKPNPKFGSWAPGVKATGIDTVKRNKCLWHRECLEHIIEMMLDDGCHYENKYSNIEQREEAILTDVIDNIISTLYKAYNSVFPIEHYEMFEGYTKEGSKTVMATLARRQADLGRPIPMGDRQGYVMVRFLNEKSNSSKGEKARIIGDFDIGDSLDTLWYVERTQTPYDAIMIARYQHNNIFSTFWNKKARELSKLLKINIVNEKAEVDPAVLFCDVLRSKISSSEHRNFNVPNNYYELIQMQELDDYTVLYSQTTRTYVTRQINILLKQGWCLLMTQRADIVNKILQAISLDILDDFIRIVMSPAAYSRL